MEQNANSAEGSDAGRGMRGFPAFHRAAVSVPAIIDRFLQPYTAGRLQKVGQYLFPAALKCIATEEGVISSFPCGCQKAPRNALEIRILVINVIHNVFLVILALIIKYSLKMPNVNDLIFLKCTLILLFLSTTTYNSGKFI